VFRSINFLLFSLIISQAVFGQKADSLEAVLGRSKEDTSRVRTLTALAWQLRTSDPGQASRRAQEALVLAGKLHDEKGQGDAWNVIGVVHYRRGEFVEAADAHLKALAIRERIGDEEGSAISYINLGNVYSDQQNNKLALDHYMRAAGLLEKTGGTKRLGAVFLNIGTIYAGDGKWGQALDFFREAKKLAVANGNRALEAQANNNIGVAYENTGRYDEARKAYTESYAIGEAEDDAPSMIDAGINIGNIYRLRKQYAEAMKQYDQAEALSRKTEYAEGLLAVYEVKAKIYREMQQFEKALVCQIRFKAISDSLFSIENTTKMNELTTRWQTERQERELLAREAELTKQREAERRATMRLWITAAVALLVLIFGAWAFYAYTQKQRAGELLAAQKREIEFKNEELAVKNKDITDSIVYSRRIQQALLPSADYVQQLLPESFVFYRPKDIVSGDFYWVESWGRRVLVAAADCTGHGVPGALLSVVGLNLLNQAVQVHGLSSPAPMLNAVNKNLAQALGQRQSGERPAFPQLNDGMDIALLAIDRSEMQAEFSGANNPLWLVRNGQLTEYRADRQPVGQHSDMEQRPFTSHTIALMPGDMLYIFSDGYADQFGGTAQKKFKQGRLRELLTEMASHHAAQQRTKLEERFEAWKGSLEQVDDVLVIGIRV
jgi:serine phosphatase RsbU (regulator of sigma subunit)/Flp pilus assembly protein TadD